MRRPARATRVLAHDLPTSTGTYAQGLPALVLGRRGIGIEICLDPDGEHPNGRCHRHVVSPDMLCTHNALVNARALGWDAHDRKETA